MIIPIKCFTCGCVLADKYRYFQNRVRQIKKNKYDMDPSHANHIDKVSYFTNTNTEKTPEGVVLDELRLFNMCCRRSMLTHVDIE